MINIYKYIDSKDIREFHIKRKTQFNPTEQAIIINRCESIPIDEKLKLINIILADNNPDQFTSNYCDNIDDDAYEYIATSINYKQASLDKIKEESQKYLFMVEISEIENGYFHGLKTQGYFSNFDKAYQCIKDYCNEFGNSNTKIYSIITRNKLNSYENPIRCIFNNDTMINIQAGDDPTFFDYAEFHIDIPFSAGDIVKYKSITGEFYGVLSEDINRDRYPNKIGNFRCSLDCFDADSHKFYFTESTSCFYLEKCSIYELPENQRILLAIRGAYKDNRKFMTILMHLQEHSLDVLSKEAYEFLNRNEEDKL